MKIKKAKLIIYWDYELEIEDSIKSTPGMRSGGQLSYENTNFILDYLKKNKVKTCFAVVGYNAEIGTLPYHAPKQIRRMAKDGHEVASHGYTHRDSSLMNFDEFVEELKQSKCVIEKVTKKKCVSFVPPRNMPLRFAGLDLSFGTNYRLNIKRISFNKILHALKKTGYRTFRQYHKAIFNISPGFKQKKGVFLIPLITSGGFGTKSIALVKRAVKNKNLCVVYSHPKEFIKQKKEFINFIKQVKLLEKAGKLEIITPVDLIKK